MSKIGQGCSSLSKVGQGCSKLSKIGQGCSSLSKIGQGCIHNHRPKRNAIDPWLTNSDFCRLTEFTTPVCRNIEETYQR